METKTLKRTLVAEKRITRFCCLKKFVFEKVRLQRGGDGNVESEIPFEQTLYLFVNRRKQVWLTQDDFESLCFLLDMEWKESTPSLSP